MAHLIESDDRLVLYGGQPAWHGLGTVLTARAGDRLEALDLAGLSGWDVRREAVYTGNPDDGYKTVGGSWAIVRGRDNKALGVVGDRFTILSNEDAAEICDYLVGADGGFNYETAGSLKGGRIVWLLLKTPPQFDIEIPTLRGHRDKIESRLLLTNYHDGSGAVKAQIVFDRVVCHNTLRLAQGNAATTVRVVHTATIETKLRAARDLLGLTASAVQATADQAARLAQAEFTDDEFRAFLGQLVPIPEVVVGGSTRGRTVAESVQETISQIYFSGSEEQGSVQGTRWGALNAVSAYNDHNIRGKQTNADDANSVADNRFLRVLVASENLTTKAQALLV